MNRVAVCLYSAIFIHYMLALKASFDMRHRLDPNAVPPNLKILAKFRLHFFTIWNFMIQIFFLVIAILDEASKHYNLDINIQKRLGRIRSFIFSTIVFPCSLLVMTVFWSIWHIDRELIFPKAMDTFYPSWLNHTLHTFIVVPLIIEILLPKKYSFVDFKRAAAVLLIYCGIYQTLYMSVYIRHNVWLYPIYGQLSWMQRIFFTALQFFIVLFYQKVGIELQNLKKPEKIKSAKLY